MSLMLSCERCLNFRTNGFSWWKDASYTPPHRTGCCSEQEKPYQKCRFWFMWLQRRQVDPTIVVLRETKVPKVHSRRMGYPRWVFLRTGRTLSLSLLNKRSIKLNKKRFKMTVKKGSSHNISLSCASVCHRIWMTDVHLSEKVIGHSNGNPSEAS